MRRQTHAGNLASGGGGGGSTFLSLTDTPSTYVAQGLKQVRVNIGETALEFFTAAGGVPNFADNETPTGLINDVNTIYTLTNAPNPAASLCLYLNGILQKAGGVDYTLVGNTITYVSAPQTGDTHLASYRY